MLAFSNCGFVNLVLPDSVETIGESAFQGCENLVSLTLGNGLKSYHSEAVWLCENLEWVKITGTTVIDINFADCPKLTTIYVPNSMVETYEAKVETNKEYNYGFTGSIVGF